MLKKRTFMNTRSGRRDKRTDTRNFGLFRRAAFPASLFTRATHGRLVGCSQRPALLMQVESLFARVLTRRLGLCFAAPLSATVILAI
jgi:hypothetical protein